MSKHTKGQITPKRKKKTYILTIEVKEGFLEKTTEQGHNYKIIAIKEVCSNMKMSKHTKGSFKELKELRSSFWNLKDVCADCCNFLDKSKVNCNTCALLYLVEKVNKKQAISKAEGEL
jgi:hypothetical protein